MLLLEPILKNNVAEVQPENGEYGEDEQPTGESSDENQSEAYPDPDDFAMTTAPLDLEAFEDADDVAADPVAQLGGDEEDKDGSGRGNVSGSRHVSEAPLATAGDTVDKLRSPRAAELRPQREPARKRRKCSSDRLGAGTRTTTDHEKEEWGDWSNTKSPSTNQSPPTPREIHGVKEHEAPRDIEEMDWVGNALRKAEPCGEPDLDECLGR